MNIIIADDEQFALMDMEAAISEALPDSNVHLFNTPTAALECARRMVLEKKPADIAFLDIEMGGMNGIQLAKRMKDIYGNTNIVFVTGHSHYAVDAFAVHAGGYILKPVTVKAVLDVISYLRSPATLAPAKKMRVQTFGNFEVFVDGKPLRFPRSKSKELFAYLVHKNGTGCTMREIAAVLFEDNKEANVRPYVSALIRTLDEAEVGDVINKDYNSIAVNPAAFDCDYYRFLKADAVAINEYTGEYMAQYSWAEFMTGYLDEKAKSPAM